MNDGKDIIEELFQPLIGMEARILLGHGSFLTMDFGREVVEEIKTRKGKKTLSFGEWHFWVYMCAWRIDVQNKPFIGSDDSREIIQEKIPLLSQKKVQSFAILNNAFDAVLGFEEGYALKLFSYNVVENKQWMLYTPDQHVFTAGPGSKWSYERSKKD